MRYQLFDINKPTDTSLNIEAGYHAIIAVNVLHDAENLPETLNRLRELLAHDGHLILIEATDQFSPMQLATVGFIEGINAFSDFREQQKSAMLSLPAWLTLLTENGFEPQLSFPNSEQSVLRQHLIVAKNNIYPVKQALQHDVIAGQQVAVVKTKSTQSIPNVSALKNVQQAWSAMLNCEVNQTSDFFQSGGDSLMATKMVVALNKAGFTKASLALLFEKPILADFVVAISDQPDTKAQKLTSSLLTQQVETIREEWVNLLNQPVIDSTDFFQDGGDSLMATKMVIALQQAGILKASLQYIFEQPIFSDFCVAMSETDSPCQSSPKRNVIKRNEYSLTPLQNAYWLGESKIFSLGNGIAHFYAELEIHHLNQDKFTQAWNKLIKTHGQLRGTIKDGNYHIADSVPYYQPQYVDLKAMEKSSKQAVIDDARRRIAANGMPTEQWPLFDISIVQVDSKISLVHLVIDLVVADGRSLNILFQHLQALYQDINAKLDLSSITAGQYFEQLDNLKSTSDFQIAKDYWLNRLSSLPEAPALPLNDDRGNALSQSVLTQRINKEEWAQLQRISLGNDVLPSMTMLATFCMVLKKWSDTKHFSINVLHSNRQHIQTDSDSIIGNLSTTSMLEVNATEQKSFIAFIKQIQQQMSDDLTHAIFDGQQVLTEKNRHNRNFSTGMPIVFNDTTSIGQNKPLNIGKLNQFGAQTPHVYLDCMLISSPCGGIDIKWTIQESHLKPGIFSAMFSTYVKSVSTMLDSSWEQPLYLPIDALQIKTRHRANATSKQLLLPHRDAQKSVAKTLGDLIRHGIEVNPNNVAIQQGDFKLTYSQVWNITRSLAAQILAHDDSPLVAIVMEKSWEQVIAAVAIILAGKAYMPIDASYPQKRIENLLEQGAINTIISQRNGLNPHFEQNTRYKIMVPCLTSKVASDFILPKVQPSNLAYVIFTSGSTGKPKGVMMDHQALVNTLLDINQRINLTCSDKVLAISALNFDLSVFDIFSTLCQGATLVIPEVSPVLDPEALVALSNDANITVWNSVPAFVQLLADSLEQNQSTQSSIRQIMMSGDWIPVNLPDRLTKLIPKAQVLSLGGATEAAIWSISHPITKSYSHCISIPYGKPLSNQTLHILDDELAPCPEWVSGEIYIAGNGLAIGYWKDQAQTDTAFCVHPNDGLRLYKTGDLGRYLPSGDIELIGRNDNQVKVNGYRVELGEIEHTLRQYSATTNKVNVQEAIVMPFKHRNGGIQLIAYVVYRDHNREHNEENNELLLNYVKERLPPYMCPAQLVVLDTLPLTANGKVDRKALLIPDVMAQTTELRQPNSDIEIILAKHWQACLNLTCIAVNQSFFELGGNSLIAVRLINQINTSLDTSLTAGSFQANDTIELLANFINTQSSHLEVLPTLLTASHKIKSNNSTLFIIHPIGGHLLSYQRLATQLKNVTLYGLNFPEQYLLQDDITVEQLAKTYLTMIRKIQPQGPYHLSGWSFGGVVAFELANQMRMAGYEITHCIMIDSYKPSVNETTELSETNIREYFYADCLGRFPELNESSRPNFDDKDSFSASVSQAFASTIAGITLDTASISRLFAIYRINLRAMMNYQPPVLADLPVVLFTADQNKQLEFMRYQRADIAARHCHGWTDCCTPLIHDLQADHYTILQEPKVTQLANHISQLLTKPLGSVVSTHNIALEVFENE